MRLIDADALKEHKFVSIDCYLKSNCDNGFPQYKQGWNDAIDAIIDNAPTADDWQKYSDELWKNAYKEGYKQAIRDGKTNFSRQQGEWIPVSERLPDDLEPVNITWINHEPEPYYKEIKDKPFTATGVYFNGQWYWWSTLCTDILAEYSNNFDDIIDTAIEVIAWQPLPEPFEDGSRQNDPRP